MRSLPSLRTADGLDRVKRGLPWAVLVWSIAAAAHVLAPTSQATKSSDSLFPGSPRAAPALTVGHGGHSDDCHGFHRGPGGVGAGGGWQFSWGDQDLAEWFPGQGARSRHRAVQCRHKRWARSFCPIAVPMMYRPGAGRARSTSPARWGRSGWLPGGWSMTRPTNTAVSSPWNATIFKAASRNRGDKEAGAVALADGLPRRVGVL